MRIAAIRRLVAILLGLAFVSPASAATLLVNGGGQLTGATGVLVAGSSYNVSFEECSGPPFTASCNNLFTTSSSAALAAQALLDQVLIDSGAGAFDSNPALTFGCGDPVSCLIAIPYSGPPFIDTQAVLNLAGAGDSFFYAPFYVTSFPLDTGQSSSIVFARFSTAVPEPSSWALMLLGFGAVGIALRRRKHVGRALA